jgi:hypothetical protein
MPGRPRNLPVKLSAFRKSCGVSEGEGWTDETFVEMSAAMLKSERLGATEEGTMALKQVHLPLAALVALKQGRIQERNLRHALALELRLPPEQVSICSLPIFRILQFLLSWDLPHLFWELHRFILIFVDPSLTGAIPSHGPTLRIQNQTT